VPAISWIRLLALEKLGRPADPGDLRSGASDLAISFLAVEKVDQRVVSDRGLTLFEQPIDDRRVRPVGRGAIRLRHRL
jgi:hypothetical protein